MNIKHREEETLRSYITCFNKEAFSIDEADDKIVVVAFMNRLQICKLLLFLYKNDSKTMLNVLYKATKYMNAEDALLAREKKLRKRERQEDVWQDRGRKMARTGEQWEDRRSKSPRENSWVSLRWLPWSTRSWCRLRTKEPWRSLASWREIQRRDLETSIATFTVFTAMTQLTVMT